MELTKKVINQVYTTHINDIYILKNEIEREKEMISSTNDKCKQNEYRSNIKRHRAKINKILTIVKNESLFI